MAAMPEARALHGLYEDAVKLVVHQVRGVPRQDDLGTFLEHYVAGQSIAKIARLMGISREWCSRHHRKEATRLVALQMVRILSQQKQKT